MVFDKRSSITKVLMNIRKSIKITLSKKKKKLTRETKTHVKM